MLSATMPAAMFLIAVIAYQVTNAADLSPVDLPDGFAWQVVAEFVELEVDSAWERGLIGVTLDPRFQENGYVYVLSGK